MVGPVKHPSPGATTACEELSDIGKGQPLFFFTMTFLFMSPIMARNLLHCFTEVAGMFAGRVAQLEQQLQAAQTGLAMQHHLQSAQAAQAGLGEQHQLQAAQDAGDRVEQQCRGCTGWPGGAAPVAGCSGRSGQGGAAAQQA